MRLIRNYTFQNKFDYAIRREEGKNLIKLLFDLISPFDCTSLYCLGDVYKIGKGEFGKIQPRIR
jgi:hypothetical protein